MNKYYKQILTTFLLSLGFIQFVSAQGDDKSSGKPATIDTKKGGTASAGNHQVSATGSKGGGLKIDKSGLKIQGKNGGKVELGKKDKPADAPTNTK